MGHAIPVRTDYTAGEVRRLAQRAKDAAQARRLLAIAVVLDDIVDHCCYAWNTLIDQPWKIMSIARRDWAAVGHSI